MTEYLSDWKKRVIVPPTPNEFMTDQSKNSKENPSDSTDLSAEDARLLIKSIEAVEKEEVEEMIRQRQNSD